VLWAYVEQPDCCGEQQSIQRTPVAIDELRPPPTQTRFPNFEVRNTVDVAHVASVDPYVRDADDERDAPHSNMYLAEPTGVLKPPSLQVWGLHVRIRGQWLIGITIH
jgi:hypothetical protein